MCFNTCLWRFKVLRSDCLFTSQRRPQTHSHVHYCVSSLWVNVIFVFGKYFATVGISKLGDSGVNFNAEGNDQKIYVLFFIFWARECKQHANRLIVQFAGLRHFTPKSIYCSVWLQWCKKWVLTVVPFLSKALWVLGITDKTFESSLSAFFCFWNSFGIAFTFFGWQWTINCCGFVTWRCLVKNPRWTLVAKIHCSDALYSESVRLFCVQGDSWLYSRTGPPTPLETQQQSSCLQTPVLINSECYPLLKHSSGPLACNCQV